MTDALPRKDFLDAQRINRRAATRFAAVAALAAVLSSLPLSILLSPLVFAVGVVLISAIDVVASVPPKVWEVAEAAARFVPQVWASVTGNPVDIDWLPPIAVVVIPGVLLMLAIWLWIRFLFAGAGVGGVLARLSARPPRPDAFEERQVVNIVEEIAIAGGIAPPRVMVIDSPATNAAAIGLTIDDATVLITRGLLHLDRDARQAVLAHVVASVANGDLKIASAYLAVFQTWGLLALLFDAPFGSRSRLALRSFVSLSAAAWRGRGDRAAIGRMLDRLLDGAGMSFDDLDAHTDTVTSRSPIRGLLVDVPLYLTLGVGAIAAKTSMALSTLLVFGPWLAAFWRSRRRLADATAVQLTRHPSALANAVREMDGVDVEVAAGAAVSFLFPFWPRWTPESPPRDDIVSHILGLHLDTGDRLRALEALGATNATSDSPPRQRTSIRDVGRFAGWTVVAVMLVAACIAFNVLATAALMWGIWSVFQWVA